MVHNLLPSMPLTVGQRGVSDDDCSAPPIRIRWVADLRDFRKPSDDRRCNINRIDRLEREGLIDRTSNPRDRRSHFVSLTPHGVDLAEEMYKAIHEVDASFFQSLGDSEVLQLAELLSMVQGTGTKF